MDGMSRPAAGFKDVEPSDAAQEFWSTAGWCPFEALGLAYPGSVIASDRLSLPRSIDLVESHRADAICFPGIGIDAEFLGQVRIEKWCL